MLSPHRAIGSLQQALVCFEKRLVVAHELGEAFDKAQAYGELGTLHSQLGNYEQAISCLERQLSIAREMKDRALEGSAACGLGSVYQQMGEHDTALQYHQLDLHIAEETQNPACQGRAYGNLGLTYESLGTYERAVVYQEQHLSIAAQMNDLVAKTASYSSLGRTHHALQNYSQAVMYLQEGESSLWPRSVLGKASVFGISLPPVLFSPLQPGPRCGAGGWQCGGGKQEKECVNESFPLAWPSPSAERGRGACLGQAPGVLAGGGSSSRRSLATRDRLSGWASWREISGPEALGW